MEDRKFLFTEIKRQVELLLKKYNMLKDVSFLEKLQIQPESPFNMIMVKDSEANKLIGEEFPDKGTQLQSELEDIFEKYEYFSQMDNNILYLQKF